MVDGQRLTDCICWVPTWFCEMMVVLMTFHWRPVTQLGAQPWPRGFLQGSHTVNPYNT